MKRKVRFQDTQVLLSCGCRCVIRTFFSPAHVVIPQNGQALSYAPTYHPQGYLSHLSSPVLVPVLAYTKQGETGLTTT